MEYDGAVKDVKIPVIENKNGEIWIGTTTGLCRFSPDTKTFSYFDVVDKNGKKVENVNVTALFTDKNGTLLAGTTNGLYFFDSALNQFWELQFITDKLEITSFENTIIRTILADKNGNLLVGTEGRGLFVISSDSQNRVVKNYTAENSELGDVIITRSR